MGKLGENISSILTTIDSATKALVIYPASFSCVTLITSEHTVISGTITYIQDKNTHMILLLSLTAFLREENPFMRLRYVSILIAV